MDAATSAAFTVGAQALKTLNNWLDDTETAKSWYGKEYKTFTGPSTWPPTKIGTRKIKTVFTISKDDWQKVIEYCLSDCYTWHRHSEGGECCWLSILGSLPKEMRSGFLQTPKRSLSSLGIVASLPAARIDLWGLVVLAYANGAKVSVKKCSTGSFCAKLAAISFTLTISQADMVGPIVAHLEPKERCLGDRPMLTSSEWHHLLLSGHTFKAQDHVFGWPISGKPPANAPEDLVTNVLDQELAQIVMDYQWVEELKKQLREVIYECYDGWEYILNKDLVKEETELKRIEKVQRHLLSSKLLLVDEVEQLESVIQEERVTDTLHYAERQLEFILDKIGENGGLYNNWKTTILPSQRKIVALTRLLTLPQRVICELSTRDTGIYVSLA